MPVLLSGGTTQIAGIGWFGDDVVDALEDAGKAAVSVVSDAVTWTFANFGEELGGIIGGYVGCVGGGALGTLTGGPGAGTAAGCAVGTALGAKFGADWGKKLGEEGGEELKKQVTEFLKDPETKRKFGYNPNYVPPPKEMRERAVLSGVNAGRYNGPPYEAYLLMKAAGRMAEADFWYQKFLESKKPRSRAALSGANAGRFETSCKAVDAMNASSLAAWFKANRPNDYATLNSNCAKEQAETAKAAAVVQAAADAAEREGLAKAEAQAQAMLSHSASAGALNPDAATSSKSWIAIGAAAVAAVGFFYWKGRH